MGAAYLYKLELVYYNSVCREKINRNNGAFLVANYNCICYNDPVRLCTQKGVEKWARNRLIRI